jgi:hypothetical protein
MKLTPAHIKQALRLYWVTDEALCLQHSLLDVVQLAADLMKRYGLCSWRLMRHCGLDPQAHKNTNVWSDKI